MVELLQVEVGECGIFWIFLIEMEIVECCKIFVLKVDIVLIGVVLGVLLGRDWIDLDYVDLFDVVELDDFGLVGFLI